MKPEDKELLLKDLCVRLPYEPVIEYVIKSVFGNAHITCRLDVFHIDDFDSLVDVKPHLRPMSSMTEEEKVEYCDLQDKFLLSSLYPVTDGYALYDWLNAHHFDYRGLIEKGLAIEVTKDNNHYKD